MYECKRYRYGTGKEHMSWTSCSIDGVTKFLNVNGKNPRELIDSDR